MLDFLDIRKNFFQREFFSGLDNQEVLFGKVFRGEHLFGSARIKEKTPTGNAGRRGRCGGHWKNPLYHEGTNDIEVYRQANVFASCGREQKHLAFHSSRISREAWFHALNGEWQKGPPCPDLCYNACHAWEREGLETFGPSVEG
jgi:hypothetical protein